MIPAIVGPVILVLVLVVLVVFAWRRRRRRQAMIGVKLSGKRDHLLDIHEPYRTWKAEADLLAGMHVLKMLHMKTSP